MGDGTPGIRRRTLLGSVGTVALGGLAGCTAIANWIGDKVLGDVNLFNETTERLKGSIVVTDPDGATALDDRFDLSPSDDEEESNNSSDENEGAGIFEDVWTESGTYEVTVALADGFEVQGDSEANGSVTIDDPDEEMLAVVFGADEFDDGIGFATGTELTDFRENQVE